MKEQKIKQYKHKRDLDSYALYNFPYYSNSPNSCGAYPVKALLACLTAAFGIMYIARLLEFGGDIFTFAAAAFVSCGLYFVLLGFFKGLPVAAFTLCGLSMYCFCGVKWFDLGERAEDFLSQYMLTADGKYLHTSSSYSFYSPEGAEDFMLLISIAFGIIMAFSVAKRFHPDVILLLSAALAVPSFLSGSACFYPSLAVFAAGLMALWAMNQSMGANIILASNGALNARAADSQYRKNTKTLSPAAKIITDGRYYSKHISDGIIIFIIIAVAMSTAAYYFPFDGSIKFDKAVQKAVQWGQDAGKHFNNVFADLDFQLGGKSYLDGYFSADGNTINISNSINPNTADRNGYPVLEVTTENKDKLYLRGDIGYAFDGDNWFSISEINYSSLKYSTDDFYLWSWGLYNETEDSGVISVQDIFDNYIPEIQTLYAKNLAYYQHGSNYVGMETVKIDYLKNMNTVLFPGTPFVYNFRENDNFKVYGDFIAVSDGRKINSMETGVLYINRPAQILEDYSSDYVFSQLDTPLTLDEYHNYLVAYEHFVYDYYTKLGDYNKRIISTFADKCLEGVQQEYYTYYEFVAKYCDAIMNYLNSGRYKYSLTADNFSGDMDPIYNFLYNTREGHCAMYATAMCLALRCQGIPARYVTGFTLGGDNCETTSDGHYKYTVTDKDLHAWVEVYYEGLGWVPYDPTPGSLSGDETVTDPVTETTAATPIAEETTASSAEVTTEAEDNVTSAAPITQNSEIDTSVIETVTSEHTADPEVIKVILIIIGIILILLVIFMTIWGLFKKLNRKQSKLLEYFKNGDSTNAVKMMLPFMLELLNIRGVVRIKGETPEEFGKRADSQLNIESVVINTIPIFEKSEFDKDPVFEPQEQQAAYECIIKLLNDTLNNMKAAKRLSARIKLFGKRGNLK